MPEIIISNEQRTVAEAWLSENGKPIKQPEIGKSVQGWEVRGKFVGIRQEEELLHCVQGHSVFGSYSVLIYNDEETAQGLQQLLRATRGVDRVPQLLYSE